MFRFWSWLKSLFTKSATSTNPDNFDVYHPKERLIYRYWNGHQQIFADPLCLYRRMLTKGPELSIDMKVSTSPMKDAHEAHVRMLAKIREIFCIEDFEKDGMGLTELETVELLNHFLVYCDLLKKKSNPTPTLSTPTAASAPSSPVAPATPSFSAYGLTGDGSSTSAPQSSPTAPV